MKEPVTSSRKHAPSSTALRFITSTNADKADPTTRRLIRSHVMQGKKTVKNAPSRRNPGASKRSRSDIHVIPMRMRAEQIMQIYTTAVPKRIGSDLSFVEFADDIEYFMVRNALNVADSVMNVIFPLMSAIGLRADLSKRMYPIQDVAALHITASAIEDFIHKVLRGNKEGSPQAMLHYQKGLGILRSRFSSNDDEAKMTNSTIGAVLKLATISHFNGDYPETFHHMQGIRKIVDLRGGLEIFVGTELQAEIMRHDLSIALHNGKRTLFFQSLDSVDAYPKELTLSCDNESFSEGKPTLIEITDKGLGMAWQALKKFCLLLNLGKQTNRLMPSHTIHQTMASVMYRLLAMEFSPGSIDETVRYGMLAFSHNIFLQWQDIRLPYPHFPDTYRRHVRDAKLIDEIPDDFMLWLLMIGAISVFDASHEPWLIDELVLFAERKGLRKWKDMHQILKIFLWVNVMGDTPAKRIFESLAWRIGKSKC